MKLGLLVALIVALAPATARAQGPVSVPGHVGLSVGRIVDGQEQVVKGALRARLDIDGIELLSELSGGADFGDYAPGVTQATTLRVENGWAVLDDTLTLSAPATVRLLFTGSGLGHLDVGIGSGCAGPGARTAPGLHADSLGDGSSSIVPISLPQGTSPVNAIAHAAGNEAPLLRFVILVPEGVTATSGSGALPIFPDIAPRHVGVDRRWSSFRDACSLLLGSAEFDSVTTPGDLQFTSAPAGPAPPTGYVANRYVTFSSTASGNGLKLCFYRDTIGLSGLAHAFQRVGTQWADLTIADTDPAQLCARPAGRELLLLATPAAPVQVGNYPDFATVEGLTLNGSGGPYGGRLHLAGFFNESTSVFTNTPLVDPARDFHVRFAFALTAAEGGRMDGLTFTLQRDPRGAAALGPSGAALGYGAITPSVAVEFDAVDNTADGYADRGDNHVAIDVDGDAKHPLISASPAFDLIGEPVSAWIDYDAATKTLSAFAARSDTKPVLPLVKTTIDLGAALGGRSYPGITAATGGWWGDSRLFSFVVEQAAATTPPPDPSPERTPEPTATATATAQPSETPAAVVAATPKPATVKLSPVLNFRYSSFSRRSTRFTSLIVTRVPAGSTVKVTCKGKGCPKGLTKRSVSGQLNLKQFIRRPVAAGTVIKVTVTNGGQSVTGTLTVRRNRAPVLR